MCVECEKALRQCTNEQTDCNDDCGKPITLTCFNKCEQAFIKCRMNKLIEKLKKEREEAIRQKQADDQYPNNDQYNNDNQNYEKSPEY